MKKKHWFPIVLSVFVPVLFLIFYSNNYQIDREQYEQFLLSEFEKIPQPSDEQLADLPKPTRPDLAAIQDYFMTLDPNLQRVPTERLKTAYLQTQAINKQKSASVFASDVEWIEVPSNMAGRTRAFMIDPNDLSGNTAWAGSVTGGLWVNNNFKDNNSSWQAVESFWSNLVISCIVADPNNSNTFYVGTGEAQTAFTIYRESSGVGAGIWKTTDGGLNWELISSSENFKFITDIEIKNNNGTSEIYAGVTSGIYKGANHQSEPTDGLYRSVNNGNSWEQVLPNIKNSNTPYAPADIEITTAGQILVGSMRNLNDEGGGTILYSDDGTKDSWSIYDGYVSIIENSFKYNIPGRVILASAPSNPDVIYALYDVAWINSENNFKHSRGQYILKSTRKGAWNPVSIPSDGSYYWASIGWHALAAAVDPNDENTIYVGGLDTYKSTTGGSSWHRVSDWTGMYSGATGSYIHADIHKIMFLNNSSNEMIVTTDGGVFHTTSANEYNPVFAQKNQDYNTLQFYTCAIDPRAGSNIFLGGLQDNGTVRYSGNPISFNSRVDGGDGAFCFIDQNEPNIMISSIYYNRYFFFANNNFESRVSQSSTYSGTGIFINPADYDNNLNILYANATTFLNQNKNRLLRISGIPNAPQEELILVTSDVNVPFSHLSVSPYSPTNTSTLFAGTQSGRLFKIENAQAIPNSTEIGDSNFPTANISSVAVGSSEDELLVTFSNYGVSSIWYTTDGGQSWLEKEGNLPDMPVRWSLFHPYENNIAYIATEMGVWATEQLNEVNPEWIPLSNGLPNVRVDMIKLRKSDQTILAATHGRGLAYTAISQVGINDQNQYNENFKLYPNPAENFINLRFKTEQARKIQLQVYDPSGRLVFSEEKFNVQGLYTKSINLADLPKGIFVVNLRIDDRLLSKKIIHQ